MQFLTAINTDIGIKKKTNQDSALIIEAESELGNILLAVVCDGMGGLAKGEVASSALIHSFENWFETELPKLLSQDDIKDKVFKSWENIVFKMNDKISGYGRTQRINLGTTVVAMLFVKSEYYIINIGDSRAYCIYDRTYQLTKDQTFVQREMDMGRMTYQEALESPQRNVLLQCVGASSYIEPAYYSGTVQSGQIYMLCSDGFRHLITEQEIYERLNPYVLVNEQQMKDNAVYLTELNKYRREQDNISVILVRVD